MSLLHSVGNSLLEEMGFLEHFQGALSNFMKSQGSTKKLFIYWSNHGIIEFVRNIPYSVVTKDKRNIEVVDKW